VHHVLGRHRKDDPRRGWLSGLDDEEGEKHPTQGGLRIGKKLPERREGEPLDERLEWERDGQYFHYLTRWMHALRRVSEVTGDATPLRWAAELAKSAYDAFVYAPRMVWKKSIDLSRPLVPSMGQHDPLDGYLTLQELQHASTAYNTAREAWPRLEAEIAGMAAICHGKTWTTVDPLGLGGLLYDAFRAARLRAAGASGVRPLPQALLDDARMGLQAYLRQQPLNLPASYRLPFRELGLAIGFHALQKLGDALEEAQASVAEDEGLVHQLPALLTHAPLAEQIEAFWCEPAHQESNTWIGHPEINAVMLATSLAPGGYLGPWR
jgi:hypothetical protein